jgi:phenylacetic acid degradation operon negative regulatory protein
MKPKTEELLYFLLWSCERLLHPTWRNLTDSFEGWAYRNGFLRQLRYLEKLDLLESQDRTPDERSLRLTEAGRLHALGGRDPEACWRRPWDGRWRLVLFDVPVGQDTARNRLRHYLRERGFGYLQKSVWITPHALAEERQALARSKVDVEALLLLEARPAAGETDAEIVEGAWDFDPINENYAHYLRIISRIPSGALDKETAAKAFRRWASQERAAWLEAVSLDPFLPEALLPAGYLGREAWQARIKAQAHLAQQLRAFGG